MGACILNPHCMNLKGEVVESKLFKDLYHYTSDRQTANEFYSVGTNKEFLERVKEEAEFDENGEITFESLRKITGLEISKEKVLKRLNKEIKAGKYTYEEAIAKVQQFNRSNQFRHEYLATVLQIKDGKYQLSVVERNSNTEAALNRQISNRNLLDRLIYRLQLLGVNVSFLQTDDFIGRYSTENAKRTADGLYNLIYLSLGNATTETLAEEAGHFAVGALGQSPLVERLTKLLTPEVLKLILGEEYDTKVLGKNPAREVAGVLVGRALNGNIDKRSPWSNLVSKIINLAKRIFHQLSGNKVARDKIVAEAIADKIAQGFMSPNFMGDVETALQHKETLYDKEESINVKTFRKVITELKKCVSKLQAANIERASQYKALVEQIESSKKLDALKDFLAAEAVAEALVLLADKMLSEIPDLLASVDSSNRSDYNNNMVRNAKSLREVRIYFDTARQLIDLLKSVTRGLGVENLKGVDRLHIMDKYGGFSVVNLIDEVDKFDEALTKRGIAASLILKERELYLRFLESSYGSTYVSRAARMVFRSRTYKTKDGKTKTSWLTALDAEDVSLSKLMNHLQKDITWFERWFASMSNSSDIIHLICDKAAKEANKRADDLTNQDWDLLRALEAKLKKLGIKNTDRFCERSSKDGSLTGNIISAVNRGDWEDAYLEFREKAKEDFKEEHPEAEDLTDFLRSLVWGDWFRTKVKREFHDIHSTWDKELNMYVPNTDADIKDSTTKVSYTNHDFDSIRDNKELKDWYDEYIKLKKSIDSRLPEGSMPWYRMPQFKGTFSNKVRNRKITSGSGKAFMSTLRKTLRDLWCEDCDDTEFGSDQTYDVVEDDTFEEELTVEMDRPNRIPLYGINKMKDRTLLSTNLFYSTLAYSGMANTHAALGDIVDVMEIGSTVMQNRTVGNNQLSEGELAKKGKVSNSYARYLKFLDKLVYLIGLPKIKLGKKIVINKIAMLLNSMSRALFLGGNVQGGIVNTGTGSFEILKEAMAGQYFDIKDWRKANIQYFNSFSSNIANVGSNFKLDTVSLFIRHFNVLNDSRSRLRDWHTNDSWLVNALEGSLYYPYKTGDHYMQTISYLSLANHIKVYNSSGEEMSLFDAYGRLEVLDYYGNLSSKFGKTYGLKELTFKSTEDIEKYELLQRSILDLQEFYEARKLNPLSTLFLSAEQLELLEGYGYSELSLMEAQLYNEILTDLNANLERLTWNAQDEADFMNKAREINIRLHGIYNSYDGVAFLQSIYGTLLLSMRQYALGLIERRLGQSKYNTMLKNESEGTLVTVAKTIVAASSDVDFGFKNMLMSLILPWSKKQQSKLKEAGFSDTLVYNLKRNALDVLFIGALWGLSLLTAAGDDDDDEDDTVMGLAHYFTTRWAREQAAFNTPWGVREEGRTVLNLFPSAISGLIYMEETARLFGGAQFTGEDDTAFYYSKGKEGLYDKRSPKYKYKILSKVPYYRSYLFWQNPYEATKSYKFGHMINN